MMNADGDIGVAAALQIVALPARVQIPDIPLYEKITSIAASGRFLPREGRGKTRQ